MADNLLIPNQYQLLERASQKGYIADQFYLTGGTALSYFYFKHRFSEDLDFFSEKGYNIDLLLKWAGYASRQLKAVRLERETLRGQDIFYFYFGDSSFVKVDFAFFPFAHFGEFLKFNDLRVSSIEDIALNKLQAIVSRKRSRDFVDLFFCLRKLSWGVQDLQKNYQLKFDIYLSSEQLATSFSSAVDSQDLPRFLGKANWGEVENYFLKLSNDIKPQIIDA